MTRLRSLAALIAISLIAVACGGSDAEVATAPADLSGTYDTVSGTQIDLGSLEGQDTVLWFWAPW